jgi:hypothetical protein
MTIVPSKRLLALATLAIACATGPYLRAMDTFVRADATGNGIFDFTDGIATLHYLITGQFDVECLDAADYNDDGTVTIDDSIGTFYHLFLGISNPAPPHPNCGEDTTADALGCDIYEPCIPPNISSALGNCGGFPADPFPNSLTPGTDLHKVTVKAPGAVCNDGTPAVYYVKAAPPNSQNSDKWVIWLQGGSACGSYEGCQERWCGTDFYDASKMSTHFTPLTIGGGGVFNPNPVNGFYDWNHVFVYYCSSDGWKGQKTDAIVEDGNGSAYSIHFMGHKILEAIAFDLLDGGVQSNNQEERMPALADASHVIFSGTSAGGGGALHNADWFADFFDPTETEIRLVLDASLGPDIHRHPDPAIRDQLVTLDESLLQDDYEKRMIELYDAFLDQSCVQSVAGTDNEWRCADSLYTIYRHLQTPVFIRKDLRDTSSRYEIMGIDTQTHAFLMHETLTNLGNALSSLTSGPPPAQGPGVYGPNCGQHVAMNTNGYFLNSTTSNAAGASVSFYDALINWLQGNNVNIVDEANPALATSTCP